VLSGSAGTSNPRRQRETVVKVHKYDAPFPEVVKALISGVEKNDMSLVCYINVQENARERGLMIGGNRILEVFRPDYAIRVWEADIEAGVDVPIRIHVCEGSDGYTYARYREPSNTFAPYDNDALSALGAELDPIFERVVESGDRAMSEASP